jgi:hypothetical protein
MDGSPLVRESQFQGVAVVPLEGRQFNRYADPASM